MSKLSDFFRAGSLNVFPGDSFLTGGLYGLNIEYNSVNSVNISAGIAYDSTNLKIIIATAVQTLVIPSTINTVQNIFICSDGVARVDTDVDGSSLSAYKIRWIGFVCVDSTGEICMFLMNDHNILFTNASEMVMATLTSVYATVNHIPFLPPSRIVKVRYGVSGSNGDILASLDGVNNAYSVGRCGGIVSDDSVNAWGSVSYNQAGSITFDDDMFFRSTTSGDKLLLHSVDIKR